MNASIRKKAFFFDKLSMTSEVIEGHIGIQSPKLCYHQ